MTGPHDRYALLIELEPKSSNSSLVHEPRIQKKPRPPHLSRGSSSGGEIGYRQFILGKEMTVFHLT
jgi:hypothetical protein